MNTLRLLPSLFAALLMACGIAQAQTQPDNNLRDQVNAGVVRIIAGPIGSTTLSAMADLANTMRGVDGLRIIPIIGKGSLNNVRDLLYLEHTDLAIVQLDALEQLKKDRTFPGLDRRIAYITKLFNEEIHLLARAEIGDIRQLAGKRVGIGLEGSGVSVTATAVFDTLGIATEAVYMEDAEALEQLKQGKLDAVMLVEGKPSGRASKIAAQSGLRLLPIPADPRLLEVYLPSRLDAQDYPTLIPAGESIDTLAVASVMIAFNWRRDTDAYAFLSKFTQAFFDNVQALNKAPYHPKWQDVNLTAQLPGWRRFGGAEEALAVQLPEACTEPVLQAAFRKFMASQSQASTTSALPAGDNEQLFRDFLQWLRTNRG